jgi:AmmeMemoRadiSam system protein A
MDPAQLLEIARSAILARLTGRDYRPPRLPVPPDRQGGVFVTLYSPGKMLRGCIGHIGGDADDLGREIAACAVSAAMNDPRFDPVTPEEYGELELEISLLSTPERTTRETLDPKVWGVVVSQGRRRGVLLPDIDGVDTVAEQLGIACRKGGIDMERPFEIDRFTVDKIR